MRETDKNRENKIDPLVMAALKNDSSAGQSKDEQDEIYTLMNVACGER